MSIENTLERIAAALEKQVELLANPAKSYTPPAPIVAPAKTTKTTKAAPAATTADIDMGGDAPPPAAEKVIDQQVIREKLRDYTVAMGRPKAIELAKKYGAKEPVLVTDIPAKNYAKLVAEIEATLAQGKGDV